MIRLPTWLVIAVVAIATITCVRLGTWQLSRLAEKKRMNAELRASLERPPIALGDTIAADTLDGRVVSIRGHYDPRMHIVLGGWMHEGEPGVEVFTPLLLRGGIAVLIDRGWLAAEAPAEVHPERSVEPGEREVRGRVEVLARGHRGGILRAVTRDSATILLGLRLDPDTLTARLPYPVAGFTIRELPGPGVGSTPLRTPPEPFNESMHLGYAVQWFAMAAIIAGGSIALALKNRPKGS